MFEFRFDQSATVTFWVFVSTIELKAYILKFYDTYVCKKVGTHIDILGVNTCN